MNKRVAYPILAVMVAVLALAGCGAPTAEEIPAPTLATTAETVGQADPLPMPVKVEAEEGASSAQTESGTTGAAPRAGAVVNDTGFRPAQHGFSFPNYGDDIPAANLTPAEMHRMFGDAVCARGSGSSCVLSPVAQQWMEQANDAMKGGHCEGMAVLSLLMFKGQVSPAPFGGRSASALRIEGNEPLQREIAYWWATQAVPTVVGQVIKGAPTDILDVLKQADFSKESYTIGIYKPDMSGGHAITPFGVKDAGKGLFVVQVYDNNYPGQERELLIDVNENSWVYEASINPQVQSELYSGDAGTQTLDLTPTSARLVQPPCEFCVARATGAGRLAAPDQRMMEVFLDGEGRLLITDDAGRRLGYVDGRMVNEIPGAQVLPWRMGVNINAPEPRYALPASANITVTIDGRHLAEPTATDLFFFAPGFAIGIEQIDLQPGRADVVNFYPRDEVLIYETDSAQSPYLVVALESRGKDKKADYYFEVQGADMQGGGVIGIGLDSKSGNLTILAERLTNDGVFSFVMNRVTREADEAFYAEGIQLRAGAQVFIDFADWQQDKPEGLYFGVDLDGDDVIDDEYTVDNAK